MVAVAEPGAYCMLRKPRILVGSKGVVRGAVGGRSVGGGAHKNCELAPGGVTGD